MVRRFFLAPDGSEVAHCAGEDHADIGRRVLEAHGVTPRDYEDIYNQMFNLDYIRVVEYPTRICAENPFKQPTSEQAAYLNELSLQTDKESMFNEIRFAETRRQGTLDHEMFIETIDSKSH